MNETGVDTLLSELPRIARELGRADPPEVGLAWALERIMDLGVGPAFTREERGGVVRLMLYAREDAFPNIEPRQQRAEGATAHDALRRACQAWREALVDA